MSAGQVVAAGDAARGGGLSQAERVVDVFVAPSKTFTDILRNASWWLPFLLLVVMSIAASFVVDRQVGFERVAENQIHQSAAQSDRYDALPADGKAAQLHAMSKVFRYTIYGSFVFVLVFVAIFALLYWATFNFGMGARTTYGQMFALWMYASLPKLLLGLLTIATLLAGANVESYNLQNPAGTNLAYYMPDSAPWLRSVLSFFDVLSLWQLILLVIGSSIIAKVSRGKAAAVVFGWWMLGLIVSAGMASFQ